MRSFTALAVLGAASGLSPLARSATAPTRCAAPFAGAAALLAPTIAAAADSYEYGAVSAPDWVLPAGAFLSIATAGIGFALQSGDDASREIFEDSKDSFGKKDNNVLNRRGDV
mmetsp:Transcript_15372/g.47716  ORF Transcript_15372/g.47716 Transcript_15372/m.47716 type:complete len:113 (-) Transcript_15372:60-398(-)